MASPRLLIPTVLPPLSAAEEAIQRAKVRQEAERLARRLRYLQAMTPGCPRTITGAIPMRGSYAMPESGLRNRCPNSDTARKVKVGELLEKEAPMALILQIKCSGFRETGR
jgi:hypothetical protein